ncbi:hypothetical protein J6590_066200 [Homalodisca vitripennis]|nr:hypothetical protein J6590_066200 [Homalodisca vitripennis]
MKAPAFILGVLQEFHDAVGVLNTWLRSSDSILTVAESHRLIHSNDAAWSLVSGLWCVFLLRLPLLSPHLTNMRGELASCL